jgi:hypothetical protein
MPQCPISQLKIPATFLGDSSWIAEMVIYHLPCHWVHPLDCQKIPPGANGQLDPEEGFNLLVSLVEGLGCTAESDEVQELVRGGEHCLSDW